MRKGVPHGEVEAYACPVTSTISVVGGKWKALILYHLIPETRRFNQLMRLMPEITQRMLTLQLRELEADRIVRRVVYAEVPPKVEYSLTPLGQTLIPLITTMRDWGAAHEEEIRASREGATGPDLPA